MILPKNFPVTAKILSRIPRAISETCFNYFKNPLRIPAIVWGQSQELGMVKQLSPLTGQPCAEYALADHYTITKTLAHYKRPSSTSRLDFASHLLKTSAFLASGKYHDSLLAATIVGQGKTYRQAQVDVAELIDFWNFNSYYLQQIKSIQPVYPSRTAECGQFFNQIEYLPLNGLTAAITPFNFTAIGANLSSLPAVLGNPTIWKPSDNAVLSNYIVYKILIEAGLEPDLLSFLPSDPSHFTDVIKHKDLAALAFTGSTRTFNHLSQQIYNDIESRNHYPRLIGETGGKNFSFLDESCDLEMASREIFLSAFEYSGQKCSACSVVYLPKSLLSKFLDQMKVISSNYRHLVSNPLDKQVVSPLTGPLINSEALKKYHRYLDQAKNHSATDEIIFLSGRHESPQTAGYYAPLTIVVSRDSNFPLFQDEIFGPILTIYPYDEDQSSDELADQLCQSSPYALTGAVFSRDLEKIEKYKELFAHQAGNFYVNVKCTGSVVGQQPFGGPMKSGTNDKAGGLTFPLRFLNSRTIKERLD